MSIEPQEQGTAMLVFVSYARPDLDRVLPIVDGLQAAGFKVWIDVRELVGGQDWRFEVELAMDKADVILAFVSANSVDRRGFVQRELRSALDKQNEKLFDDIYLVPVRLDEGIEVPRPLQRLHYVSASGADVVREISTALTLQAARLSKKRTAVRVERGVWWESRTVKEGWDGFPGFSVGIQYLQFHSDRYEHIGEVTEYIKGRLLSKLFEERGNKIDQMPELFKDESNVFRRTNTYDASCLEPNLIGRVLSMQYRIHWYGAGAAHPNMHFETYNFVLEPLTQIKSFIGMFTDISGIHSLVQRHVRKYLYDIRVPADAEDVHLDREWIDKGTESTHAWDSFWFTQSGVEFLFAPYEVGCYADGSHTAHVSYETLLPLMRPEFRALLLP